jgi:predicted GIY-YIG superfamily endonuclease
LGGSSGSLASGIASRDLAQRGAQHIGHAAREATRRRRIEELEIDLEAAARIIAGIQEELAEMDRRSVQLQREIASAPVDADVRHALIQIATARESVSGRRLRLTEAENRLADKRRLANAAVAERDEAARDFGLIDWINNLGGLIEAIHQYGQILAGLWPVIHAHAAAREQLACAEERLTEAARHRELRVVELHELQGVAAAAAAKFKVLESTIGATVREVRQKLEDALLRVRRVRAEKKGCRRRTEPAEN